jgi:hypothetical protein
MRRRTDFVRLLASSEVEDELPQTLAASCCATTINVWSLPNGWPHVLRHCGPDVHRFCVVARSDSDHRSRLPPGLQPCDFGRIETLQGVVCIHEQSGLPYQGSTVECGVVRDDHDATRCGRDGLRFPPRWCAHRAERHMRIAMAHTRQAAGVKPPRSAKGGRAPEVFDSYVSMLIVAAPEGSFPSFTALIIC